MDSTISIIKKDSKISSDIVSESLSNLLLSNIREIKERILVENRNNSIDSIIDGSTLTEIKIENDDEFKELMKSSSLLYIYI